MDNKKQDSNGSGKGGGHTRDQSLLLNALEGLQAAAATGKMKSSPKPAASRATSIASVVDALGSPPSSQSTMQPQLSTQPMPPPSPSRSTSSDQPPASKRPPLPGLPALVRRAVTTNSAPTNAEASATPPTKSPTPKTSIAGLAGVDVNQWVQENPASSSENAPNLSEPPSAGGHARRVSWGVSDSAAAAAPAPAPEINVPNVVNLAMRRSSSSGEDNNDNVPLSPFSGGGGLTKMSSHSGGSKLSMKALMSHNPVETEVESHMMSALEELDPTRPGLSEAQKSILGGIDPDVEPGVFESDAAEQKTTLPVFRPKGHKKATTSTAEELFLLSNELMRMQRKSGSRSSITSTGSSDTEDNQAAGDALARNAIKLMKRHRATAKKDDDDNSSIASSTAGNSTANAVAAMAAANRFKAILDKKKAEKEALAAGAGGSNDPKKDDDIEAGSPTSDTDDEKHDDDDRSETRSDSGRTGGKSSKPFKKSVKARAKYREFEDWLKYKKIGLFSWVRITLFYIILPATGLSAILFYLASNPPCGNGICKPRLNLENNTILRSFVSASASWWILFVGVRQVITLSLAMATSTFIIDYIALSSQILVRLFGPLVTLFIVQSKGWPMTVFWWGVYDFALLYGRYAFAKHWLFWQEYVGLFNEANPAGTVQQSKEYASILSIAIVVSVLAAVKRCYVGLSFGRQTYLRYGDELARVMTKALMIGQVASLARDIEVSKINLADFGFHVDTNDEGSTAGSGQQLAEDTEGRSRILDGMNLSSRKAILNELLGEWEEPEENLKTENASIGAIIQFRQSLSCLNSSVPFSAAFGSATTRPECVACAEALYHRLKMSTPDATVLTFDVIALLAIQRHGSLDEQKVRDLIKLFRPDREGNLTLLDFVKSIDSVYKDLRLLRASVSNSSKLDRAFEGIINVFFYIILFMIAIAVLGIDPLVLFASVSGFILGFAFMIGAACSKYVEGLLLIFVRKPYNIGDRIHVSNPVADTSTAGSPGWIVKDVDLFTTTVIFGATNEVATYSNQSLAQCRIINAARSPKATLSFLIKFPIDTPYERLKIFKSSVEKFVKARPRDWASFLAFRSTRVEVDLGFVEYVVVGQHRESWQTVGALLDSKAELTNFCLELSKKMNMRYRAPPMPVDISMKQGAAFPHTYTENPLNPISKPEALDTRQRSTSGNSDYDEVANMFE